jgi:inner membrane protein
MPMTTTHMLVPLAATLAFARRPIPWKLVIVAAIAAAVPDLDGLSKHFLHVPEGSIYSHRGALHSLFVALAAGLIAALFHRRLEVRPLTAGVIVSAAMASHGILDMMTDSGQAVAYLWPVSSVRLFADWRPIHSGAVHLPHMAIHNLAQLAFELWQLSLEILARFRSELWQLILPMFAAAFLIRVIRTSLGRGSRGAQIKSVSREARG